MPNYLEKIQAIVWPFNSIHIHSVCFLAFFIISSHLNTANFVKNFITNIEKVIETFITYTRIEN